jgi:hypothetical protein
MAVNVRRGLEHVGISILVLWYAFVGLTFGFMIYVWRINMMNPDITIFDLLWMGFGMAALIPGAFWLFWRGLVWAVCGWPPTEKRHTD